jgi:hypothetical protein
MDEEFLNESDSSDDMSEPAMREQLIPEGVQEYTHGGWVDFSQFSESGKDEIHLAVSVRRTRDFSRRSLEVVLERPVGIEYLAFLWDMGNGKVTLERSERLLEYDGRPDYAPALMCNYCSTFQNPLLDPFVPLLTQLYNATRLEAHLRSMSTSGANTLH